MSNGIKRVQAGFERFAASVDQVKTEAAVYAVLSEGGALAQMITPMDSSTLANSQYDPQIEHKRGKTTGTIGYTAIYAGAVHQMPGTMKGKPRPNGNGNYWDPDGEPQFLTKGFKQLQPRISGILERIYRV